MTCGICENIYNVARIQCPVCGATEVVLNGHTRYFNLHKLDHNARATEIVNGLTSPVERTINRVICEAA